MYCNDININELLKAFHDKGYYVSCNREGNMDRLIYDNIIVGTFNPDLYTYNDYDVISIGNIIEIHGKQRLYVDSLDIDTIVKTVIDSINKYTAKSENLNAKKNILVSEHMKHMKAYDCINYLILNKQLSPYFTGYCTLPNGQICWGTNHGKYGAIIVNSDNVFYFINKFNNWEFLNLSIQSTNNMLNLKQCIDDIINLPMKKNKKYWKFTWKTLIKYASTWIPGFTIGNTKYLIKR